MNQDFHPTVHCNRYKRNSVITESLKALFMIRELNRVIKCDVTKTDFSEIMGFMRLFGITYLKKVHAKYWLTAEIWVFEN